MRARTSDLNPLTLAQDDPPAPPQEFMRPRDAASFLGVSLATLERLRRQGDGPHFLKPTSKVCLYAVADLREWALRNRYQNTIHCRMDGHGAPLRGQASRGAVAHA